MNGIDYSQIGNLRKDYVHEPGIIRNQSFVVTPNLVLKLYLTARDRYSVPDFVRDTEEFLGRKIGEGEITPLTGLGFAILSDDILNVARWDTKYPIVVKNQIYGFEEGNVNSAQLLDIRDVGSFCVWELEIVNHEKNAWKRFLTSQKAESDKRKYLQDIIIGELK